MDLNYDIYGEIAMEYFCCQTDLLEKDNIPKIEYFCKKNSKILVLNCINVVILFLH